MSTGTAPRTRRNPHRTHPARPDSGTATRSRRSGSSAGNRTIDTLIAPRAPVVVVQGHLHRGALIGGRPSPAERTRRAQPLAPGSTATSSPCHDRRLAATPPGRPHRCRGRTLTRPRQKQESPQKAHPERFTTDPDPSSDPTPSGRKDHTVPVGQPAPRRNLIKRSPGHRGNRQSQGLRATTRPPRRQPCSPTRRNGAVPHHHPAQRPRNGSHRRQCHPAASWTSLSC